MDKKGHYVLYACMKLLEKNLIIHNKSSGNNIMNVC